MAGARLSIEEREEIAHWLAAGHSVRQIALRVGRSPSTVSRELARNISPSPRRYRPYPAHIQAAARARREPAAEASGGHAAAGGGLPAAAPGLLAGADRWQAET